MTATTSQLSLPMGGLEEQASPRVQFVILAGIAIAQRRAGHLETAKEFQELARSAYKKLRQQVPR